MFGYGEDALTLWAVTQKLDEILASADDKSSTESAVVFFRPSFGRRGGPISSQFGEFDFVIATPFALHLGETKWQSSPETAHDLITLRPEQLERHKIFAAYYEIWISRNDWTWPHYSQECEIQFPVRGIRKPVVPLNSLLSKNLQHILEALSEATNSAPTVNNILMVVKSDDGRLAPSWRSPKGFKLAVLDATAEIDNGFLPMHFQLP